MLSARIGAAVRQARLRRRLTQAELASRAGISPNTLQRLERGDPGCALGNVLELMVVLDQGLAEDVVVGIEADPNGRALEDARLPARVRNEHF